MKRVVFIVLALAMVVCVTAAFAQGGPPAGGNTGAPGGGNRGGNRGGYGGGGMGMGGGVAGAITPPMAASIARLTTSLTLTQDQQDKITAILTKSDTDLTALRQKGTAANLALRNALQGATYDAEKGKTLLADAQAAEAAIVASEMQTWTDVRAQLTSDQLAKLPAAMTMGRGAGGGGRGGRGTRGNNPGGGPPAGGPVPPPAPAPDAPPPAPAT